MSSKPAQAAQRAPASQKENIISMTEEAPECSIRSDSQFRKTVFTI